MSNIERDICRLLFFIWHPCRLSFLWYNSPVDANSARLTGLIGPVSLVGPKGPVGSGRRLSSVENVAPVKPAGPCALIAPVDPEITHLLHKENIAVLQCR